MKSFDRLILAVVTVLAFLPATAGAQASGSTFWVQIEGTKQGLFANESVVASRPNRILGRNFDYLVKVPRDASTGALSGRRQHAPVVLTKEWGAASPQLFQALVSNEILKSVVFEFSQTNQTTGQEEIVMLVKLTGATVVEIHQYTAATVVGSTQHAVNPAGFRLEDVSFMFSGIEIQHLPGKTMAADQMGLTR
jgi:type VI secretion system secreted protein Hcp